MPETLHPKTLSFLKELKQNNNKAWFDAHRDTYDVIRKQLLIVIQEIINELNAVYPSLADLKANDCLFRIYRDVRFSKNKEPYKHNFAASIAPGGRKSIYPGYYLHIEPNGKSYIGGGLYRPQPAILNAIRQEIDYNDNDFLQIVKQNNFVKTFGNLYDDKVQGNPRGYSSDNKMITWLRYKSFIAGKELSDNDVYSKNFVKTCVKHYL
jgi:uncharacterized protein (TIGR02453 family)